MTFLKKYWILIIAVILAIAIFVWNSGPYNRPFLPAEKSVNLEKGIEEVNESLKKQLATIPQTLAEELAASRIYFMLSPKGANVVQSFVFENGAFSAPDDNDMQDYNYSYSSDGSKAAFFAIPEERKNIPGGWGAQAQLYVSDMRGVNDPAFPELSSTSVVDATDVSFKQYPDVSNSGEVLFIGSSGEDWPGVEHADNHMIYHVVDGAARPLIEGYFPKWINDSEFIFLKNDGLYRASTDLSMLVLIATSTEKLIWSNNIFDISDDGTLLSWIQPGLSQLLLFRIDIDGSLELLSSIPMRGFWNAFSPSGNYLAVQTIDPNTRGTEDVTRPKIEFIDTNTFSKVPELEINFEAFDQMHMFMTDWVVK